MGNREYIIFVSLPSMLIFIFELSEQGDFQ
uniref:Uncharacterized protein n=1 Tax=Myoviridae sp. ctLnO19 TaxID=2825085 RepID=A0A8S5P072_9CAUD|nr:MAG TPA: hypothetical protein [Myoviridae sp. ctLnO19]DAJ69090.1 MAG TPA: hypothetical protein [Caudoviricetes sp.]DAM72021.1 MAG TPA: hypothetical protein [Caudoviricetes sp.]DAW44875.1 MAG TPA: hypothetical protein [Caudoviricetes sp.]DAX43134.1 MAG TPA: hypothetical protein [Caudoviricetes sp.]